MSPGERIGRAYCAKLGADPDEVVGGYYDHNWVTAPRWAWYQGARL